MGYKWSEITKFERNKLVAEKHEGKTNVREDAMFDGFVCEGFNNFGDVVTFPVLNYSEYLPHAFRLLDEFWEWRLVNSTTRGFLCYGITHKRKEYRGEGSTLAEAICKCSLRSLGVEVE